MTRPFGAVDRSVCKNKRKIYGQICFLILEILSRSVGKKKGKRSKYFQ